MIEERVPPQNIEAEQAVLGAMLIDKEAIAKATELLSADDFYREAHRVIFSAMLELYNKNEAVDMVTVTEILKRDNKLEDIGGIAYITSLANVVLTAANVKYHAEIVAEKSVLRQLVRVSTEIAAMGYEANDDVGTLLDTAESRILEISVQNTDPELAKKTVDEIANVASNYIGDKMEVIPPKIIEIGKIPTVQSSPSMKKNVVMGFVLGVVAAAAIVVVITIMDDTLKSEDDIAKYLGISVLAVVPDRKDYVHYKGKKRRKKRH